MKGGAGKFKVCLHWPNLLSPIASGICNPANLTAKADTFVVGVQCVQCSAQRLALHLAEFFSSKVGRSLEFVEVKKLAKNLEMTITTINGPRCEFNFVFHSAKSQSRYLLIRLEFNK